MNQEGQVLKTEAGVFPLKFEEEKRTDAANVEVKEVEIAETKTSVIEEKFARLKKSLRKRSVSIL